jgi:Cu+-exporting ATPase
VLATWGLTLKPEFAGLAMAMSSVSVVLNSLLLRFFNPKKKNWISLFAPVIMTVVFISFFWNFAKLGNGENITF